MGEGDLQRLSQLSDRYTAQAQAHQAIVQHLAAILQAELGALWKRDGGPGFRRGYPSPALMGAPGNLQDPRLLPGEQSLWLGDQGTQGPWATFFSQPPAVSCPGWITGSPAPQANWPQSHPPDSSPLLAPGRLCPLSQRSAGLEERSAPNRGHSWCTLSTRECITCL